jgi:hypothetical protein
MSHDGHIGVVELGFELHHETRGSVMRMDAQRKYDFNPRGKYNLSSLNHTIQVLTPADCGHSLNAQGQFRAFYILLPLPISIGPYNLPAAVSGVAGCRWLRLRRSAFVRLRRFARRGRPGRWRIPGRRLLARIHRVPR